jgi:tetratricopeptide (TPR) repeat protein
VDYYRSRGEYVQAIAEARALIEKYPESNYAKDFVYQIGDFYCRLGKFTDAIQYYESRKKEQPAESEPAAIFQYLIGESFERSGDWGRAREEYRKVRDQHGSIADWSVLSEFSEAMLLPREALAHPESTDLAQKAVAALAEFAAKHPTDKRAPSALMTTASLFRMSKNTTEALQAYDQVIAFDTSAISSVSSETRGKDIAVCRELAIQAHLAKALLLRTSLDQPLRALDEYEAALAKKPQCDEALIGKAVVLLRLGRSTEARPILDAIVKAGGPLKDSAQELLADNFAHEVQP